MVEVNNLTAFKIGENFLKKIIGRVLKGEKRKKSELSVVLVSPQKIKTLNKKYRRKNKVTDVLSFLYDNSGEIVICPAEVKKNAKKFKTNFKKELARVLIHGTLHLLGYNHEAKKAEAEKMAKKENYYLDNI